MESIQSNRDAKPLVLFQGEEPQNHQLPNVCPPHLWPIPAEMLALFEEITGWVVEFQETRTSYHRRRVIEGARSNSRSRTISQNQKECCTANNSTGDLPIADGKFSIIDMSPQWPAGRPTSHRAKCDQFLELLNQFLREVKTDREQLQQAKSLLAGTPHGETIVQPNDMLTDTFASRHPYQTASEKEEDFVVSYSSHSRTFDELQTISADGLNGSAHRSSRRTEVQFTLAKKVSKRHKDIETYPHQNASRWQRSGFGAMSKWQLGGRRGMLGNIFIDWCIEDDGRVELIQGKTGLGADHCIESASGSTWESKLVLNPRSDKFWLSGDAKGRFWMLDLNSKTMTVIPEKLCQLKLGQAIIASASPYLLAQASPFRIPQAFSIDHADRIAKNIQEFLGAAEPVLALTRLD